MTLNVLSIQDVGLIHSSVQTLIFTTSEHVCSGCWNWKFQMFSFLSPWGCCFCFLFVFFSPSKDLWFSDHSNRKTCCQIGLFYSIVIKLTWLPQINHKMHCSFSGLLQNKTFGDCKSQKNPKFMVRSFITYWELTEFHVDILTFGRYFEAVKRRLYCGY